MMIYTIETSKGCKRAVPTDIALKASVSVEENTLEWSFTNKQDAEKAVIAFINAGFDYVRRMSIL